VGFLRRPVLASIDRQFYRVSCGPAAVVTQGGQRFGAKPAGRLWQRKLSHAFGAE